MTVKGKFICALAAACALLPPIDANAARAKQAPPHIVGYVSNEATLRTERIAYSAAVAGGGGIDVHNTLSPVEAAALTVGNKGRVVVGVTQNQVNYVTDKLAKIDIPIGYVEYHVYAREGSGIKADSWEDVKGLRAAELVRHGYITAHIDEYVNTETNAESFRKVLEGEADITVCLAFDGVSLLLPEGIERVGVVESSETYIWYNEDDDETGELMAGGLESLISDGVFDDLYSNRNIGPGGSGVVFQLSSYNSEMVREAMYRDALRTSFAEYDGQVTLYTYQMNAQRAQNETARYNAASDFIKSAFMVDYPDVIIVSGNYALEYLQKHYSMYFSGVPVIFNGIEAFDESMLNGFGGDITGITEVVCPVETIEAARRIQPSARKIYALIGAEEGTESIADANARLVSQLEAAYGGDYAISTSDGLSFSQMLDKVSSLDKDAIILIGMCHTDAEGLYISEREFSAAVSKAAETPVFCVKAGYVGYGAVGGRYADVTKFAERTCQIAAGILEGASAADFPIVLADESDEIYGVNIFDRNALNRFQILDSQLPHGAVIINGKLSMIEAYPLQFTLLVTTSAFCLLAAVLIALTLNMRRKRDIAVLASHNAEEANYIKSMFLAKMSHEIRTPMNAVIGLTRIAKNADDMPGIKRCLEGIDEASRHLMALINDVLDMSKIESGRLEISEHSFDYVKMCDNALSVIADKAREKRVSLEVSYAYDFTRQMLSDELRLSQVIINLLSNAVKFTPVGGKVCVTSEVSEVMADGAPAARLVVSVSDTGIGISEEAQNRLFRAFEQADNTITRKYGGTGLGLAISKQICQMLGGDLTVESSPGNGSTFIVNIPVKWGADITRREDAGEREAPNADFSGKRILIADDIDVNRVIVSAMLNGTGAEIDEASDGTEAVSAAREHSYDLILMDMQMPVMDGLTATRAIRAFNSDVPILAMTANAFKEDAAKCLEAGMNGHLSKPIDPDVFIETASEYLERA